MAALYLSYSCAVKGYDESVEYVGNSLASFIILKLCIALSFQNIKTVQSAKSTYDIYSFKPLTNVTGRVPFQTN